jgi:solute carrier family 25 S-adenosylmethionine transporter 26
MVCGAVGFSIAQTVMFPADAMKIILQSTRGPSAPSFSALLKPTNFRRLTRGVGANFILSLPQGAITFGVLEFVRRRLGDMVAKTPALANIEGRIEPGLDIVSSITSSVMCSVVFVPHMTIMENIMAGNYPNLPTAVAGLYRRRGVMAFYAGWWPILLARLPAYALTWAFFQQMKKTRDRVVTSRSATDVENTAMGCLASAASVCIMIPMDTVKTRLVTQVGVGPAGTVEKTKAFTGIIDCAIRTYREDGLAAFYRGLPPRLASVVPMAGIEFGVYESMKRTMLQRKLKKKIRSQKIERTPSSASFLKHLAK